MTSVLVPAFLFKSKQRDVFRKLRQLSQLIDSFNCRSVGTGKTSRNLSLLQTEGKDTVQRFLRHLHALRDVEGLSDTFESVVKVWTELVDLLPFLAQSCWQRQTTELHPCNNVFFSRSTQKCIEKMKRRQLAVVHTHQFLLESIDLAKKEYYSTKRELRHCMAQGCARLRAKSYLFAFVSPVEDTESLYEKINGLRAVKAELILRHRELSDREKACRYELLSLSTEMMVFVEKNLEDVLVPIWKCILSFTLPLDISNSQVNQVAMVNMAELAHRLYQCMCTQYRVLETQLPKDTPEAVCSELYDCRTEDTRPR